MSDLISRSELLKRFLVNKDGHRIPERDCDNFEVTVSIKYVKTIIKEQPTAYDIGKVVSELEKKKEEIQRMRNTCVALSDLEVCDIENVTYKRAIEIVKNIGVYDDVCEWKVKSNYYITECSHDTDVMYGLKQDFKFCPYCSKKIKVVE